MKVFYFGCWGDLGHHLWTPTGRRSPGDAGPWMAHELDAPPTGHRGRDTGRGVVPADPDEREHVWRLTHSDGWTALGAWDRTCDRRNGSKAVFVAEGEYTEDEMRVLAARWFPAAWARITGAHAEGLVRA